MDIIFFLAMFALLVATLGPHHRRTFSLPRAPFGADADVDRDLDRVLHDIPAPEPDRADEASSRRHGPGVRRLSRAHHATGRRRSTGFRPLRLP